MLFAKVSFAFDDQPIEITGSLNLTYAGFGRIPGYTLNSAGNLSFLYTDNNTGLSLGSTAPKNIGSYKVKITLIDGPNVGFFVETNFTINKKTITLTASPNTKVYDGTRSSIATPTSGTLASGDFGVFSQTYDTKDQGTGKSLTPAVVSIVDGSGADMTGNYTVNLVSSSNGIITQKSLNFSVTGYDKVYDGSRIAYVN